MKVENQFATPVPSRGAPDNNSSAGPGAGKADHRGIPGSAAFIIDLSAKAAATSEGAGDAVDASPGKSGQSTAHLARDLIAKFFESSAAEEAPFKAFGYVVSQLAQGTLSIEEIIASLTPDDETEGDGEGEGEGVAASEPAPNLLDTFLEDTEDNPTPSIV